MGWMPGRSSVTVSEAWRRAAHKSYWATAWLRLSPTLALPTPQPTSPQNKVSIHDPFNPMFRPVAGISPLPPLRLAQSSIPPRARGAAELDRYKGSSSASARPSSTSRHQASVGPGAAFVFWSPLHKHGARGAPMTTTSTHLDLEAARRGGGGGGSSGPPGYEQAEVSSLRTTKPRPPSFLPSARFPSVSIRTRAFHDLSICWIPSPRSS